MGVMTHTKICLVYSAEMGTRYLWKESAELNCQRTHMCGADQNI